MAEPVQKAAKTDHFRVMVCVDKSDHAERAFDFYLEGLHKPEHEVIIAYVVELYMPWPQMYAVGSGRAAVGMGPSPGVLEELIDIEKEKKEQLKAKYDAKCKDKNVKHQFLPLFEAGHGIGAEIVEAAKKQDASMVVLGSRGLGKIRRTLLGSVIVQSDTLFHRMAESAPKTDYFRVMICVDHSKHAERAFDYYLESVHNPGHEIIIAYVMQLYMPWPQIQAIGTGRSTIGMGPTPGLLQELLDIEKAKTQEIEGKYCRKAKNANTRHKFLSLFEGGNGVGATIEESIKKHKVGMVVLGSRGLGVIRRTLLGSVSDYVLHHSHIPTLVCPAR